MNLLEAFKPVRCFVFDIDGVLTDGRILVFENGEQVRSMSVKDGFALQLAVKKGYHLLVVSGGLGSGARERLHRLGIGAVYLEVKDKTRQVETYLLEHGLEWKDVLYMGDDIPDLGPMKKAAMPTSPADAAPELLQLARYISPFNGGMGCVRDVIEKVLRLHGKWDLDSGVPSR